MHTVKILKVIPVTHTVKQFTVEKPAGYKFTPGQATEIAGHPFTFTSLNDWPDLQFTIKIYPVAQNPTHTGITEKLGTLTAGDELLIGDPWGTIEYKGPGVFIAGGAGITPFIAIIRQLAKDEKLEGNMFIFSNKTKKDVIYEEELKKYFGNNLKLVFTQEGDGHVDKRYLEKNVKNFSQHFYVCGPKAMVAEINQTLESLGAQSDNLVFER
ncbi:hypothetical protein A2630_01755 [Candidatus Woesebacteria bacterium RIFCSPHIGHO2_01_FULL_44_10]|uniref:FAD-binding FR-type domain-containing protein n=1 Tax=Candidatus Woesebacteria bacterium RIFCSPLOWO2_01_FULL_44_14 TaxID=1802525 RepID=A0A1F8C0Y1_9BACT|nr:MAG: hypothetical protein A2630_01755 [Candidatus Woesebacteria bacterium RIFCSPHIGHO2_01_FULL_44_10]OGM54018.1 MAG: hypothetical protein A3F62_00425 [Candidatus Woesebacteria bacterium RIFCSPHIGHO2_12_FULL_44_11]OGM69986.1 MAG: hypothetical protein A2975_05265 [Candidatus Woesebacteria bacterium RIFCSPLOWO2_01_FULL_44_14]